MHDYVLFYGGESAMQSEDPSKLLRDTDITALQRAHRFVRTEQVKMSVPILEETREHLSAGACRMMPRQGTLLRDG